MGTWRSGTTTTTNGIPSSSSSCTLETYSETDYTTHASLALNRCCAAGEKRQSRRMAKEGCLTRSVGQQQEQPYNKSEYSSTRERHQQKKKSNSDGNISQKLGIAHAHPNPNRGSAAATLANNNNETHNNKLAAARDHQERKRTRRKSNPSPKTCSHNNTTTTIDKVRRSCSSSSPSTSDEAEENDLPSSPELRTSSRTHSSKHRRRFKLQSSALQRILSSTFKDLSLGYYISIVMVISFKIFIFANTLNTVMGAKTFYMHWNTSNSIFRIDNTDHIIDVNKGNLAFEYDQVHIICPVYEPGTFDNETEKLIIYNVSKAEYETCRITNANPRIIAVCDKPQKLMYFTITFRPFTPSPGGLEFLPGHDYYFISTSSKDDLHRRIGGRCSTNNMKVVFKVCCGGGGGGGGGDTLMIGESNRTSPARGNTKKALAATTPQPSVKVWSVPSSPAVVSHRPTINQPVVLQNDFVMTPVQNHSYSSSSSNSGAGGPGSGSSSNNWQSSTAATKKTLKPSDFDKRANEVVKYDQELNVNEKSTTNEMVAGDAVSWRQQQQQQLGGILLLAVAAAVFRLRWLY